MKRLCISLLLIAILAGCARTNEPSTTLTILVPQSLSALPFLALADSDPRIKVEFFSQHAQALVKLLRGDADFLVTGTTQGWAGYWGGNKLVAVNSYVWGVSSLVVMDKTLNSPLDLKGKRISLPFPNAPLDLETRLILDSYKLNPARDVNLEYRAFAQAIPLLTAGKLDAAALPEPLASELVVNLGARRLFEYRSMLAGILPDDGRAPQVTLFTTGDKARSLAARIPAIHDELEKLIADINRNGAGYARRYSQALAQKPDLLAVALEHTTFDTCDFKTHRLKMLAYFAKLKSYFSEPAGALDDSFFFTGVVP